MEIGTLDFGIIAAYLLFIIALGYFIGRKETAEGFFLNDRNTKVLLLVFTSLSTSVGAGTVMGVASSSFTSGISFGITFAGASLLGWALVAFLAPRMKAWGDKTQGYTFGDFLAVRYDEHTRTVGKLVVLLAYFAVTAIQFVALARLIEVMTGADFVIGLFITAGFTILYTMMAGLKGDFYTDALQFFVMIPVFIFLFIKGFSIISVSEVLANVPPEFFNIYAYDGPVFFWGGLLFGIPLLLVQVEIWQRVFAAVDGATARVAFVCSGILKVVFIALAALLGLMAYSLIPGVHPDAAIFELMLELLPTGLLGLGFASVLAILMSTIDSALIVGSATYTKDFYAVRKPNATPEDLMRVGRWSVLVFGLGGCLVAFFIPDIVQLSILSAQILLIFGPALLGGLLWPRANAKAASMSIVCGLVVMAALMSWDLNLAAIPGLLAAIATFVYYSYKVPRGQ